MEAEKLVCRTELLFHVTKHFEVKKWIRSKKRQEEVTYATLLQYAKEHEMTVKDFNHHKSNGGITQLTTINAIETFKRGKKVGRNGSWNGASSSHRGSTDKTCNRCNMTQTYRKCPASGKKCHKCGNKNHFSSCCRNVGQGQGYRSGRTQARGRSTERHHRPSRGRCCTSRSRSWSWSSNESMTCSTHSIEIDRHDIDDIDIVKTFNSIYRSRTVASRSNDTDPDSKTKIVTKLGIKLPRRKFVNILEVKVGVVAEANIFI